MLCCAALVVIGRCWGMVCAMEVLGRAAPKRESPALPLQAPTLFPAPS